VAAAWPPSLGFCPRGRIRESEDDAAPATPPPRRVRPGEWCGVTAGALTAKHSDEGGNHHASIPGAPGAADV